MNELIEKVSKKSIIAKAPEAQAEPLVSTEDYDDVYFDEEDLKEEEGESNKVILKRRYRMNQMMIDMIEVIIIMMEDTKEKSHQ